MPKLEMSRFQVITGELTSGSARVGSSGGAVAAAQAAVSGSSAALTGTPAAGAYEALVASVDSTLTSLSRVSGELSGALAQAARAYKIADQSAATSLPPRRR